MLIIVFGLFGCNTSSSRIEEVLDNREFDIPLVFRGRSSVQSVDTLILNNIFDHISATIEIRVRKLVYDSLNSVLASAEVLIIDGANGCVYFANIDKNQLNHGQSEAWISFFKVNVGYKKSNFFASKSEYRSIVIWSDGRASELIPVSSDL